MWKTETGVKVFEPTLREIEKINEQLFDHIIWIGFQNEGKAVKEARNTDYKKIRFILLPAKGGKTFKAKLSLGVAFFKYTLTIYKACQKFYYIHTRGPSVPAFIGIVLSFFFRKKHYWHKYAGNWVQEKPPLSYALQRRLLKKARHTKVTVNGQWDHRYTHVIPFENPCIEEKELEYGAEIAKNKVFTPPWTFCFVGRIEEAKGVKLILEALEEWEETAIIDQVHFIGDGPNRKQWEKRANDNKLPIQFHGSLNRETLQRFYKLSHFLLLPSASEGFPKVIAEAAAYGCIPMVSSVSSVLQYVKDQENGLIIDPLTAGQLTQMLEEWQHAPESLKVMARKGPKWAQRFTFEAFTQKLRKEVFHLE